MMLIKANTHPIFVLALAVALLAVANAPLSAQAFHPLGMSTLDAARSAQSRGAPKFHQVKSKRSQGIAVLVNDEPITNYEIKKRQGLLGANAKGLKSRAESRFKQLLKAPSTSKHLKKMIKKVVAENPGLSRDETIAIFNKKKQAYALQLQKRAVSSARSSVLPGLRKKAMEELIDEHLQLQEAKRLNVLMTDEEVDGIIDNIASQRKMTLVQYSSLLKNSGSSVDSMKSRIRAKLSWRNVIRSQFRHQISVKSDDIDRVVAKSSQDSAAKTNFKLQRITLAFPTGAKQALIAQRLKQANDIRQSFNGCANTGAMVKKFGGARLENLGEKNAATLKEPIRSMIQNAGDGEMLPPPNGARRRAPMDCLQPQGRQWRRNKAVQSQANTSTDGIRSLGPASFKRLTPRRPHRVSLSLASIVFTP